MSIKIMAKINAVIMTHNSLAIPTAVIRESKEKTTSKIKICIIMWENFATTFTFGASVEPSIFW